MSFSRYPGWAVSLAGFGAFVFLASLFALALVPSSEPASLLEQVLWAALLVAFLALLPLFFLRLKAMVTRLAESQSNDPPPPSGRRPGQSGDRLERDRDDAG